MSNDTTVISGDFTPEVNVETPSSEPPMQQFMLNVTDVENAVKVIDFAAEQGAFKGWGTINEVLNVRNRLVLFLRSVKPENTGETQEQTSTDAGE